MWVLSKFLAKEDHVLFGGGEGCFCFQVEPDDINYTKVPGGKKSGGANKYSDR
jgi:hypothetical protein